MADAAQLPVLTRFLQDCWHAERLAADAAPAFELALEEVFLNVVTHGSPGGTVPTVEVVLRRRDGELALVVADDGPAFDPLTLPSPDLTGGVAERPVGGLGVVLVRRLMDLVSYRRIGGRNELTMTKRVAVC
jgi:serine/threonine-protein kinase RsbW